MKFNEKNIFLLDSVGAALSAIVTGLILPIFSNWVGLSPTVLRLLGLIGLVFAAYSFTCFLFVQQTKPPMLLAIILANSLYCILALSIAFLFSELTTLGRAYFIGEIVIIAVVVVLETRVYRNAFFLLRKET